MRMSKQWHKWHFLDKLTLKERHLPSSYPTHVLREIWTLIYGHYWHAPVEDLNDKVIELVLCMFKLCIDAINVINIKNTVAYNYTCKTAVFFPFANLLSSIWYNHGSVLTPVNEQGRQKYQSNVWHIVNQNLIFYQMVWISFLWSDDRKMRIWEIKMP